MEKVLSLTKAEIAKYALSFSMYEDVGSMSMKLSRDTDILFATDPNPYTYLQVIEPSRQFSGNDSWREPTAEELFAFVTVAFQKAPESPLTQALRAQAEQKFQVIIENTRQASQIADGLAQQALAMRKQMMDW